LREAAAESWPPFFMQWDDPADFPGAMPARHANGARGVAWIEVATPDPSRLAQLSAGAVAPIRIVTGSPGLKRVTVSTGQGEVTLG
jgi:hypothetical protein